MPEDRSDHVEFPSTPDPKRGGAAPGRMGMPNGGEADIEASLDDVIRNTYDHLPEATKGVIEAAGAQSELQQLLFYTLVPPEAIDVTTQDEADKLENNIAELREVLQQKAQENSNLQTELENLSLNVEGQRVSVWNLVEGTTPDVDAGDPAPAAAFGYDTLPEDLRGEIESKNVRTHVETLLGYSENPDFDNVADAIAANKAINEQFPELAEKLKQELGLVIPEDFAEGEVTAAALTQDHIEETRKSIDEAMELYKKDPSNEANRQALYALLRDSKQEMDNNLATKLAGKDSWSKWLTVLGVLFSLYIGLQYATANAVENMTKK